MDAGSAMEAVSDEINKPMCFESEANSSLRTQRAKAPLAPVLAVPRWTRTRRRGEEALGTCCASAAVRSGKSKPESCLGCIGRRSGVPRGRKIALSRSWHSATSGGRRREAGKGECPRGRETGEDGHFV